MYGYLLGFIFTFIVAVFAVYLIAAGIFGMSLGRPNGILGIVLPFSAPVIYLAAAYILALCARQIFNSDQGLAFALNVSSILAAFPLILLVSKVSEYAEARQRRRTAQNAIADAPYIHLETPAVKKFHNRQAE